MAEEKTLLRWDIVERIEHHLLMILIPVLGITGLPLFMPEYFEWMAVLLGGVEVTRILHRISATILGGTVAFHLLFHLLVRRTTKILPTLVDIKNMFSTWKYYMGISKEPPKIGFHDPSAKLVVYWLGSVIGIGLAGATGLILLLPQSFPTWIHPWALLGHDLALVILLFVVLMHLYMSIFFQPHRALLDAMTVDGKVPVEYVREHHPLWYEEIMKRQKAKQ